MRGNSGTLNTKAKPSLADIGTYFLTLGATGFGGPVALADYLRRERAAVARTIAHYEGHAPFRRGDSENAEALGDRFDADL